MKSTFSLVLFCAIALITFDSCKVGIDDPSISLRTRKQRVTNVWEMTSFKVNGVDQFSTDTLQYFWGIKRNDSVEVQLLYTFDFPPFIVLDTIQGSWEFSHNKDAISFHFPFGLFLDSREFEITRLSNDDLWIQRLDIADLIQIRFRRVEPE